MVNEKLSKWTPMDESICPKYSVGNNHPSDTLVTVGVKKVSMSSKRPRPEDPNAPVNATKFVTFSLHPRALELAGWLISDRITFEYDHGMVVMYRHPKGHRLGGGKECKRARTEFRMFNQYAEYFVGKNASEIEIKEGKIAFLLVDE